MQFSGLLIFSLRFVRVCSFSPMARILSITKKIFPFKGPSICSFSVTSLTMSATRAPGEISKPPLFPFLVGGSDVSLSLPFPNPLTL